MTGQEKIYYRILDFLKSAKRDINITDEILRNQFYDINQNMYNSAIDTLSLKKAIDKTSPNNQWQITETIGENELIRLKNIKNLDEDIQKESLNFLDSQPAIKPSTKKHSIINKISKFLWANVIAIIVGVVAIIIGTWVCVRLGIIH